MPKPVINKKTRQAAIIDSLMNGAKTIRELDENVSNKLKIDYYIPEATRNRDLRDLRDSGHDIELIYDDGRTPKYVLRKTKLELNLETEELPQILELINTGIELGLIKDSSLEIEIQKLASRIDHKLSPIRINSTRKLSNLSKQDIRQINEAIQKKYSVKFIYKQPADSKLKSITAYPIEIFIQDNFLYLLCKKKEANNTYTWREYRLDRFEPHKVNNRIIPNKKDKDSNPLSKIDSEFVKIKIIPPLNNFFEPEVWNLKTIYKSSKYSIYEGFIYKPRFRIIKDFLALLPGILVLENPSLKQSFEEIILATFKTIKNHK